MPCDKLPALVPVVVVVGEEEAEEGDDVLHVGADVLVNVPDGQGY